NLAIAAQPFRSSGASAIFLLAMVCSPLVLEMYPVQLLEMYPVQPNKRQCCAAHDQPQDQSLQKRPDADRSQGFSAQPSPNQEEGDGQPDFPQMIQDRKFRAEPRQECVQERRYTEKQDEPRPLDS